MHQTSIPVRRYSMGNIESLLLEVEPCVPPANLYERVLARIRLERQRTARVRSWYFGTASFVSLTSFIFILWITGSSLSETGFLNYASLIFTDADAVLVSWKEFSLLLLESLPLAAILATLTAAFAFLWSLAHATRNMTRALLVPNM